MKIRNSTNQKRTYFTPIIEFTQLDNEISLNLESAPPFGPGELFAISPESFSPNLLETNFEVLPY